MTVKVHVCTERGWRSFHWLFTDAMLGMPPKERGEALMKLWPCRALVWEAA